MRPALALLLLAACVAPARKLDEANDRRHAGRPAEALALYREVLAELGEGRLAPADAEVRLRALQYAGDVSYLDLGDFRGAVAYYRRLIALAPGTTEAWQARAVIGDIFRDRFGDPVGAIAQWAEIAGSPSPSAPTYQLKVAREYLELRNFEQARTEARILRDRWPRSAEADEAQLLTAQAWSLERRSDEALRAFQAAREVLLDELGVEPGPTLTRLDRRVLAQDPTLDWVAAVPRPDLDDETEPDESTTSEHEPGDPFVGRQLTHDGARDVVPPQ